MAVFAYTGRDRAGKSFSADLTAPSRKDAMRLLQARGFQVATLAEAGGAEKASSRPAPKAKTPGRAKAFLQLSTSTAPGATERLPFLEALYDLTTSGLSAGEAIRLLSIRIQEPKLRALSGRLWEQLSEGAPLSRAMANVPEVFDSSITNLIQAGEATGSLNDTIGRLISHLTEQRELRRQLLAALAYPCFMVLVAAGVILFFLFFLLPRLQSLLTSLGGKMPTSTQLLILVSTFAIHWGWLMAAILLASALSFWGWRSTEDGREKTDAMLLRLPLVGPFAISQTVLSFSQTLSVLLANGITAAEALRMTERQIDNRVHRTAFQTATGRVLEGEALSTALTRTGCFPELVLDRLAVGENTGSVVPSLQAIAHTYQKKISNQLSVFTKVIASGVLMLVFLFVGFIAFAIVSAVFQVSSSFKMGH